MATILRVPYAPRVCSAGRVGAGSGCMRECTPEPCAQVRILLGAPKSNARANRLLLVICNLTWANVWNAPTPPASRPPGTPQEPTRAMLPDVSALAGNDHQDRVRTPRLRRGAQLDDPVRDVII